MRKIKVGSAWPLGSSITPNGVNFSLAAPHATNVELLIFNNEDDDDPKEEISLKNINKSGDYWHVEIEGLTEGAIYGYKVSIDGHMAVEEDLVLDPCARAIIGWGNYTRNRKEKVKKRLW